MSEPHAPVDLVERDESGDGFPRDAAGERRSKIVAAALAIAAVLLVPFPRDASFAARFFTLAGGACSAVGILAFLRRGLAAIPRHHAPGPFAMVLVRVCDAISGVPGRGRRVAVIAGVIGGAAPRIVSLPLPLGFLGLGLFSVGWAAAALLLGSLRGLFPRWSLERLLSEPDLLLALFSTLMLVEAALLVPHAREAWRQLGHSMRVRFELGGLGTRIEDMTPRSRRDILPGEALAWAVAGAIATYLGAGVDGLLSLAAAWMVAPGVAAVAGQLGSPVLAAGLTLAFGHVRGVSPFLATLLAAALLADSQRFTVLSRGLPRAADRSFLAAALLAALITALAAGSIGLGGNGALSESLFAPWLLWTIAGSGALLVAIALAAAHLGHDDIGSWFGWRPDHTGVGPSLDELPVGALALGFVVPLPIAIAFAAGAFIGRIARGGERETVVPDPPASLAAGAAAGESLILLGAGVSVLFA